MPFVYPTAQELKTAEAEKVANLSANRPVFQILPIVTRDTAILRWEQKDNVVGLQQVRGLGGQPTRVKRVGGKTYIMDPGIYGEYIPLDETELMQRRQWGDLSKPVNISDLVMEAQDQLLARRLDRIEFIAWQALMGTISILGPGGAVMHSDTFAVQTATAAVSWATTTTAAPIKDVRGWKLKGRGRGCSFGRGAFAYANTTTINNLLNNTNAADLFGKKDANQSTISGLDALNKIIVDADLPTFVEYDGGYLDDSGTWQNFIPDNKVIIVGVRNTGVQIGDYTMVRNVNNPDGEAGSYTRVIDKGENTIPRVIEVHDGHNGGPRIEYPGSIIFASV